MGHSIWVDCSVHPGHEAAWIWSDEENNEGGWWYRKKGEHHAIMSNGPVYARPISSAEKAEIEELMATHRDTTRLYGVAKTMADHIPHKGVQASDGHQREP